MSLLMLGSQAIVRGAIEAGVKVISGYPGYPITAIMEYARKGDQGQVYVEWAVNEKVALETVLGTSVTGARGLAVMKQVGLNQAAEPLMSAATWGVRGGTVILVGDDPGCSGSPVEQDSRCYGVLANLPVLEPSTPDEGRQMTRAAFAASEKFGLPVILRITKGFAGLSGQVNEEEIERVGEPFPREIVVWGDPVKGHHLRHKSLEPLIAELSRFNFIHMEGRHGIVTSGSVANQVQAAVSELEAEDKVSIL